MSLHANRIAFFDFQCGAPKSVSVMALIAGDERVRQADAASVKVALCELETFAACRSKEILGRLKRHEFTGELCAAIFEHDTSRSLDPQLHSHCVVANATSRNNRQRWSALTEFETVRAIRYVERSIRTFSEHDLEPDVFSVAEPRFWRGDFRTGGDRIVGD
jgi:conjugative relaxase-like TrwC/TraI family protein